MEETVTDEARSSTYTFMAWDMSIGDLFPFGYGDEFPAFLTYRGGADYLLVDLLRPLFNKRVRSSVVIFDALAVYFIQSWFRPFLRFKKGCDFCAIRQKNRSGTEDPKFRSNSVLKLPVLL